MWLQIILSIAKMEMTLFVPSNLMVHRKFMMFKFPAINTLDLQMQKHQQPVVANS